MKSVLKQLAVGWFVLTCGMIATRPVQAEAPGNAAERLGLILKARAHVARPSDHGDWYAYDEDLRDLEGPSRDRAVAVIRRLIQDPGEKASLVLCARAIVKYDAWPAIADLVDRVRMEYEHNEYFLLDDETAGGAEVDVPELLLWLEALKDEDPQVRSLVNSMAERVIARWDHLKLEMVEIINGQGETAPGGLIDPIPELDVLHPLTGSQLRSDSLRMLALTGNAERLEELRQHAIQKLRGLERKYMKKRHSVKELIHGALSFKESNFTKRKWTDFRDSGDHFWFDFYSGVARDIEDEAVMMRSLEEIRDQSPPERWLSMALRWLGSGVARPLGYVITWSHVRLVREVPIDRRRQIMLEAMGRYEPVSPGAYLYKTPEGKALNLKWYRAGKLAEAYEWIEHHAGGMTAEDRVEYDRLQAEHEALLIQMREIRDAREKEEAARE